MGDRVEDVLGPVLIATKLRPPTVRDQVVPRERLLERLRSGSGLGLSLVACRRVTGRPPCSGRGTKPRRRGNPSRG